MKDALVKCLDCEMVEREEWALADKHQCNIVTDPHMPATPGNYKIGKRKFVRVVNEKEI